MDPDPDQTTDEQILSGLRGGEQPRLTALRRAMEKYTFRLGGLARKYVGESDPHDVVDVIDQTFHALWQNHHTIITGSLWSWLAGVAANKSITLVRQRERRRQHEQVSLQAKSETGLSLEESGELILIAQGIEDPWSGMVLQEYIEQFALCVQHLPPIQKAVGSVLLAALRQTRELPDNEALLREVRRITENPAFSLEALKSAKKQILAKIRPAFERCEQREKRTPAS
jgi:DNA-directed RNA polymerase specialized sigma24 family protein